jgi:hypothetical protein
MEEKILEVLNKILGQLEYQTKLMEELYHKGDEKSHEAKDAFSTVMKMMKENVLSHPAFRDSPEMKKQFDELTKAFGGEKP